MNAEPEKMTIDDLLKMKKANMLRVNPEYQRGAVWDQPKQKRLIDSILRGYPIPLFYLHHIKTTVGQYQNDAFEVIDGQQRLNALHEFREGAFKLFDPKADEAMARFPDFVSREPCPWGGRNFDSLEAEIQRKFLNTTLAVVKIETGNADEARDLFIRLQASMPLTSQEKRDAWPGQFTDFVLKLAGKAGLSRYPGHDFFTMLMQANKSRDRGKFRQFAAQMTMLYFTRRESSGERLCEIKSVAIDDFYYQHLGFDASTPDAKRFLQILDKLAELLRDRKRKKILGHEAMHLILLVDSLLDDYTRAWEARLASAFDSFRANAAAAKGTRFDANPNPYWLRYGIHTRTNSDRAETIRVRHAFYMKEMFGFLKPQLKDPQRLFGPVEREVIYHRQGKKCAVCEADVMWREAEFHHLEEHGSGGRTEIENGALVHGACHPKGSAASTFAANWKARRAQTPEI